MPSEKGRGKGVNIQRCFTSPCPDIICWLPRAPAALRVSPGGCLSQPHRWPHHSLRPETDGLPSTWNFGKVGAPAAPWLCDARCSDRCFLFKYWKAFISWSISGDFNEARCSFKGQAFVPVASCPLCSLLSRNVPKGLRFGHTVEAERTGATTVGTSLTTHLQKGGLRLNG